MIKDMRNIIKMAHAETSPQLKGAVMQIEKARINDRLIVSNVP